MPSSAELAVIVCSRERSEMLRDALATITRFTPADASILVVDSASTTFGTRDAARDAGVDYVRTDVKGLSIARNLGLAASDRAYLLYTDDDCVAIEGWISGILSHFSDPRVGAVTGEMIDPLDPPPGGAGLRRFDTIVGGLDAGHGALMAFRRDVLDDLGGFDEVLGAGRHMAGAEDLDIFCRILDAGWTIVYDPACVVHHVHTRDDGAYETLYLGYGRGLGGMVGKWLRTRPLTGLRLLAVLAGRNLRRIRRLRNDPRRGPAERAMLRGIGQGITETRGIRIEHGRFVDPDRPEPIVLTAVAHEEGI